MSEAYPLHWPAGWPRTAKPERSRFDVTMGNATSELLNQLRLMGAHPDQGGTREEYEQVQSAYEQAVKMTVNA